MQSSFSAQKKVITRLYETDSFGKAYNQNARFKPILFVPQTGAPVVYESMSVTTRVTGLSKSKLVGNKKFEMKGVIKRSPAMNKAELQSIIVSADDTIFTTMRLSPLSGGK